MRAKTFFIAVLAAALAWVGTCALLLSAADPFFLFHGVGPGDTALFDDQRCQMAGLIRRQEYSQVVMGTSLAANFRASWFTRGTGEETLKITFPDGQLSEFSQALDLAWRTHGELKQVFFILDLNLVVREDKGSSLPDYLYDESPLNDLELYLSADGLAAAAKALLAGDRVPLDEAYIWEGNTDFSAGTALAGYPRPEPAGEILPEDAYLAAAERNMDVVCGWARAHPRTVFTIWFPPYSMLYWDQADRLGQTDALLRALEYAAGRLLECGNIRLCSFLNAQGLVTDLSQYADHIHCSAEVTQYEAAQVLTDSWCLWRGAYREQVGQLREFVKGYDYDGLFARYGWKDGKPPAP